MDNTLLCPVCQYKTQADWFFCPNCAHELKEKVPIISISKQILIYAVSFFLSPLGLGWGLKYVRSTDHKIKTIGIISIVLTILSITLMIIASKNFIDQYAKILNNIVPSY
ncbi:MAG: zinc ribbon domain-containing protein [Patescibacteria group bacterium]